MLTAAKFGGEVCQSFFAPCSVCFACQVSYRLVDGVVNALILRTCLAPLETGSICGVNSKQKVGIPRRAVSFVRLIFCRLGFESLVFAGLMDAAFGSAVISSEQHNQQQVAKTWTQRPANALAENLGRRYTARRAATSGVDDGAAMEFGCYSSIPVVACVLQVKARGAESFALPKVLCLVDERTIGSA